MTEPVLEVEDRGVVRWLRLNRPDKRNALNADLVDALTAALNAAERPREIRCLAITGAGTVFSAGADLESLRALMEATEAQNLEDSQRLARLFRGIATHPLPVVAALNGHAIAGGAGLAAACDVTIAVEGAKLGFPEVRIGFVPALVLNFLVRAVGTKTARELCLTGRRIDVTEARRMGLVHEVVPPDSLLRTVDDLGAAFQACSPEAIATTKRLLWELDARPLDEGLTRAAEENARARATEDCREGVSSFLEKRKPRWNQP